MMRRLKHMLLEVLGQQRYLSLTSKAFRLSFKLGLLRNNPAYANHYFVRHFVSAGNTVIDIGANLGYYTRELAACAGSKGLVLAVEPIPHYRAVLLQNIKGLQQVKVLPYALGEDEGVLKMGIISPDKHRHGLMKVLSDDEANQLGEAVVDVAVKNPAQLFEPLEQLHFIKCDIEGYEVPVVPAMMSVIKKHRPILQIETDGENKKILLDLFSQHNYTAWQVKGRTLHRYVHAHETLHGDLVAIPEEKLNNYNHLIEQEK